MKIRDRPLGRGQLRAQPARQEASEQVADAMMSEGGHGAPEELPESRFLRVVPAEAPDLRSFETLFSSGKPRCGQLRDSQREFLFGADAAEVGSVALVPLGPKGRLGLLACGSPDSQRFNPTMSTDFLAHLGELIAAALSGD